ncbi:MAG: molybdate ABC transporter substrate-binding protein [Henriciella sp.]
MRAAFLLLSLLPVFWAGACGPVGEEPDARIAVAANFREAALALEENFEATSGYDISQAFGATGQLYAQIVNGAPFDAFLSADQDRPELLIKDGLAFEETRFTYAKGELVLWTANETMLEGEDGPLILEGGDFRALAIANPDLAPYGVAAMETLASLGLADALSDRIVRGQSIGQTFAMVSTGGAEFGFVAASQVLTPFGIDAGSGWIVPAHLHSPIRQDAVLLSHGSENAASIAFLDYLQTAEARLLIERYGYEAG